MNKFAIHFSQYAPVGRYAALARQIRLWLAALAADLAVASWLILRPKWNMQKIIMAELIIFICDFLAISIGCVAVLLYYFCGKHFAEFVRKTSREGAGVSGHYVLTDSKRARSAKNESVNSINNINEHSTPRRERDTMLHDESRED